MPPSAMDGEDGHGLKFEFGPTFSSFNARSAKVTPKIIMVSAP